MNPQKKYSKSDVTQLLIQLKTIQDVFKQKYGVSDIFSNSKIYEIIIANQLGHILIPGHSGSKDARNETGGTYEYKHFKESSSNHTWTFNDYSATTIASLKQVESVVFAHVLDGEAFPLLDWYIEVPGPICAQYLEDKTTDLLKRMPRGAVNARRMINISAGQLSRDLGVMPIVVNEFNKSGAYAEDLLTIYKISQALEEITGVKNILTSNKLWEVLVSVELGHYVNSEQGGRKGAHDAFDDEGNLYEYKVSIKRGWQFQDISENVLAKFKDDTAVILAVVDKTELAVQEIYSVSPGVLVPLLIQKLQDKDTRYAAANKEVRRLQVSLGLREILSVNAKRLL